MSTFTIHTQKKEECIDITTRVAAALEEQKISTGLVNIFVPHTTAGVTINENADPDVISDFLKGMRAFVPDSGFKHAEGNSPAHIRSSLIGVSLCVQIDNGALVLGTWQGIYFCEFDGPRTRKVQIAFYAT
jgi:secondary thiamine-phosphate synthase enzyme